MSIDVRKTQDIVCSIQGANELLREVDNLFLAKEKRIKFIESGFQIYCDALPYFFQVQFDENFGWVVFLTSVSGGFEDHEETDRLYHQLEDVIDKINATYYADDDILEFNPFIQSLESH